MGYRRYAVYYLPPPGLLAQFGASWLGWDVERGEPKAHLALPGLSVVTDRPRKYGFHGTLKPPFRLAEGQTEAALAEAMSDLAQRAAPARSDGLVLSALGRFLALVPEGPTQEIAQVAADCVTELDRFRAPASEKEMAKRRAGGLSPRQEEMLQAWGYPYVLEEFGFHLTLTGRLSAMELEPWRAMVMTQLPPLPKPFDIEYIALVGERDDGAFELVRRFQLTGEAR